MEPKKITLKDLIDDVLKTLKKESSGNHLSRSQRIMNNAAFIIENLIGILKDNNIEIPDIEMEVDK